MSQAIYRKWRPSRFSDVIGQEHVTQTLRNTIVSGRIGHAYLFCGPRGTGKTTTARLLAKAVNCLAEDVAERPCDTCHICVAVREGRFLDLIEIDAASNTGVDDIRDLREKINFAPSEGRYKVYIIDEVHMLSTAAFNALLKTLEEPPPHAIFILATTEEHKILATIKSRCQQFNFRLLSLAEITDRLNLLVKRENLTVEPSAISLIAKEGAGSLRDAESLLDQLVTSPDDEITLERVQQVLGTASTQAMSNLVEAWMAGDTTAGLSIIHNALAVGTDARQFCRQMVGYLRQLLLLKATNGSVSLDLTAEQTAALFDQARRAPHVGLIEAVKQFNTAALAPSNNWQPQLPLEMAFLMSSSISMPMSTDQPVAVVNAPSPVAKPQAVVQPTPTPPPVAKPEPIIEKVEQQPVKPKPAAPPIDTDTDDSDSDINSVQTRWDDIVRQVAQNDRNLPAMLKMGRILNVEGKTVILGFQYPIFKDKFDDHAQAKEVVGDALSDVLGDKFTIRAVVADSYTIPAGVQKKKMNNGRKPSPPTISRADVEALARELGGEVREY